MGALQGCELNETSDVCQMNGCVTHVEGRAASSMSPTDTWICTLAPFTTFRGKIYKKVFMKIGINPQAFDAKSGKLDELYRKEASLGLLYELRVYNKVILPLLDANVCPHFLRSLLVSHNCTYQDLTKTLQKGLPGRLSMRDVKNRFNRSLWYMVEHERRRPAISTVPPVNGRGDVRQYPRPKDYRFTVLTTEFDNVVDYDDWITEANPTQADRYVVCLQLFIALYTMQYCKLMHNDLHSGNLFIQTLDSDQQFQYVVDGVRVAFRTHLKVMIYDFDDATCPWLGENLHVTAPLSNRVSRHEPRYRTAAAF